MTEVNSDSITGTIAIAVLPEGNEQYVCHITPSLKGCPKASLRCYGQTKEHAIAIALEQLANDYRRIAEEQQSQEWDAVEHSESGEPIDKRYHVTLHYERVAEAESKFEAMHDTIIGNTVVENAKITVIEISAELPIEPVARSWD